MPGWSLESNNKNAHNNNNKIKILSAGLAGIGTEWGGQQALICAGNGRFGSEHLVARGARSQAGANNSVTE